MPESVQTFGLPGGGVPWVEKAGRGCWGRGQEEEQHPSSTQPPHSHSFSDTGKPFLLKTKINCQKLPANLDLLKTF
jgi:hypothetical protein